MFSVVAVPAAAGDGCSGPCNGASVNPPGTNLLVVQPAGKGGPFVAYDAATSARSYTLHGGRVSADGRR